MRATLRSLGLAAVMLVAAGCAVVGPEADAPRTTTSGEPADAGVMADAAPGPFDGWQPRTFVGKRPTRYRVVASGDHPTARHVLQADADRSVSLFRLTWPADRALPGRLQFSWRIERPMDPADLRQPDTEDAPVRVVLAFDGPTAALPLRDRMFFDLAEAVTGERPPYATLMYVWDRHADIGDVIPSNSTSRIRKLVVDGRTSPTGVWRLHRRSVEADFRAAFGEAPGRLTAIGVMTDSDNTGQRVRAWYGPLSWLTEADGQTLPAR